MNALGIFPADNEADEPWHIDPKDADPRDELKRQSAFLRDAKMICPGVDIFAVPNAAKRSQWAVNKAKREGLKRALPIPFRRALRSASSIWSQPGAMAAAPFWSSRTARRCRMKTSATG